MRIAAELFGIDTDPAYWLDLLVQVGLGMSVGGPVGWWVWRRTGRVRRAVVSGGGGGVVGGVRLSVFLGGVVSPGGGVCVREGVAAEAGGVGFVGGTDEPVEGRERWCTPRPWQLPVLGASVEVARSDQNELEGLALTVYRVELVLSDVLRGSLPGPTISFGFQGPAVDLKTGTETPMVFNGFRALSG